jgi:HipA-like C-terminal domain
VSLFQIIEVTSAMRSEVEQLGSKPKFWFRHNNENWLFKEARINTGEDWSEKLASEIARLLDLSTHHTELAIWEGKRGCAVQSFLSSNASVLVHGNELLGGLISSYDKNKERGQADHTIDNIVSVLERLFDTDKPRRHAAFRMIGYLVFDALVGNTDRHHQNWGVVLTTQEQADKKNTFSLELAPTFDHASSLGRELTDEARARRLTDKSIERYSLKARGGIFEGATAARGMSPMALAQTLAVRYPAFFKPWQTRVGKLDENSLRYLVERIPPDRISPSGKSFALALLATNKHLLLSIP